jgi:hypothetical protein
VFSSAWFFSAFLASLFVCCNGKVKPFFEVDGDDAQSAVQKMPEAKICYWYYKRESLKGTCIVHITGRQYCGEGRNLGRD